MIKEKEAWDLLKELNSYCYICKKHIFLFCGQSRIQTRGCCVGYEFQGKKWITPRYAHIHCYLKKKKPKSLIEKEKNTIKMLRTIYEKKLKAQKHLLEKEPSCTGKWRKKEKKNLEKIKKTLEELKKIPKKEK